LSSVPDLIEQCFELTDATAHAFGGANLHRLPADVPALANALKRPVGPLTNKMLNLEGFRPRLPPV
jgi:hypothetical protein